jgi:hypothetical protein
MSRLGKNIFYFLFLLTTISFANAPCFGMDDGDFQFWSTASVNFEIDKRWSGNLEEEFRFGDGAGELYYQHSDVGFVYGGLAEWIDFGLNYRLVFEKDGADEWRRENRPHFNVTLKGKLSDLSVSNRSRFEYRDRENKSDMWRYRNKTTLKFPVKLTALKLQPYLADEVFINFGEQDIHRNRFYAGVALNLLKQLKGEAYYLLQSSKSNGIWIDFYVLGIQLKIYF